MYHCFHEPLIQIICCSILTFQYFIISPFQLNGFFSIGLSEISRKKTASSTLKLFLFNTGPNSFYHEEDVFALFLCPA